MPIIELVANDIEAELIPADVDAVELMALSMLPFVRPFDDGDDDVDAIVGWNVDKNEE